MPNNLSIANFVEALKGRSELEIAAKGRKTKKAYSLPVWFVHKGNRIYLLPVRGSDTDWYKNVLKYPNIALTVGGKTIQVEAEPVTEPSGVETIIGLFAEKYGGIEEIKRWYSKLDVAVEILIV